MASRWARGAMAVVLVAALCVVVFGVVRHASAAAASPQQFMIKLDIAGQPVADPSTQCAGETLTLTQGTVLIHGNSVTTGSGSFKSTFMVETHGLATGDLTGTKYTVSATDNTTYNVGPGEEFDEVYHLHVTGPGPDNNAVATATNHLTVDANGVVRVLSNTFTMGCQ